MSFSWSYNPKTGLLQLCGIKIRDCAVVKVKNGYSIRKDGVEVMEIDCREDHHIIPTKLYDYPTQEAPASLDDEDLW